MAALPNREARLATLIRLGVMPVAAEEAVQWAEARGQTLPTDAELAADAGPEYAADIERARAWWLYASFVSMQWKRVLSARVVGAAGGKFNPNHEPAGSARGGQFTGKPGGAASVPPPKLSYHAVQRMRERGKYAGVREALDRLTGTRTPAGDWYVTMSRKGQLDGYLVGTDGIVKTVLGPWYDRAKLGGLEVTLAKADAGATSQPDIRRSIAWQLDHLTPDMATVFCRLAGLDPLTPTQLAENWRADWQDWTADGLEALLIARSEAEDAEQS